MKGRKPTPTNLRLLRGNPGRRPFNENEAQPALKLPACPSHLQGEARKEWFRMGRRLLRLGLMTEIDVAALALYCQSWGRWIEAEDQLRRFGTVIVAPSGFPVTSPYLAVANRAMAQMAKILVEFGMSPSSRSRVKIAKTGDVDPFEEFLQAK